MKFTLEIELGDDAMLHYPDVVFAIQESFRSIVPFGEYNDTHIAEDETGLIRDINGNTVGKWEVSE